MERIEPEWVGSDGGEGVRFRVFTNRPFFEVRLASDPKLFLEEHEAARATGANYWVSSRNGRPLPAAPEQDVRVPDVMLESTLGQGRSLYYLLVAYADETRTHPSFSASPEDAILGSFPAVKPRARAATSVAQSLLFDPALMALDHSEQARRSAGALGLASAHALGSNGVSIAQDRPSLSKSAAIEFLDLRTIKGGNGAQNVYFVTSGGSKDGALQFKVKVRNRNDHYNFWNVKLKLSLYRVTDTKPARDIPIHIGRGEPAGAVKPYVSKVGEIKDESSRVIPFSLSKETVRRLFDANNPKARIDFELHWHEGATYERFADAYYARAAKAFYLVQPVNFMWSKAKVIKEEIRFNDYHQHFKYWTALAEHTFGKGDTAPVTVTSSVTYAVSKTDSTNLTSSHTTSATQTTANRQGQEVNVEVSAERSGGAKVGMKLEGLVDAGLDSGAKLGVKTGYKKISEVTKTSSDTVTFMQSLSKSQTFSENFGRSQSTTVSIAAKNPGRIRTLYAYPKFQLLDVPVVLYQDVDSSGMAGKRTVIEHFPVLKFTGVGTCIVEYDPKSNKVLGGDCLFGSGTKEKK